MDIENSVQKKGLTFQPDLSFVVLENIPSCYNLMNLAWKVPSLLDSLKK